jgi:stage V sporulation protein G|tara:strand:+ start:676 stop:1017 length:342 start_codon:yes stop_codon:yes gene_type:complete
MKIERMNKGEWGKLRAFFDLKTSDGFVIKGFKIVEGINGLFVGMPSVQNKEGEYYDSVFADKDLRDELEKIAIREYGQESVASSSSTSPNSTEESNKSEDVKNKEYDEDDIPF